MRIGIDARFYSSSFTGIGRYIFELIDHLLKIDTQNEYVLFFNKPEYEKFVVGHANVKKVLVNAKHYSLAEQWRFLRILNSEKLDLMHFTHFNAPFFYRRPSIVTIHDLTLNFYPGKKMAGSWHRAAYHLTINSIVRRAKKIIAVSQHTKKDITDILKVPANKITVIHEGVNHMFHRISDPVLIAEFLKKNDLPRPYILYTGVWRSHKNLVNLIKAFAILKHQYGFNGSLVITGKDDPWYPEVKQTVNENHLEGAVRFTGLIPDEDLVLLYNGALIYVLPSFYEGFGLPALEAFACGIPVCTSAASSLPEICGKGNAIFFNPHSPADMADKIAGLYNDSHKMQELIERGLARVKDFSWDKMARETLDLYKSSLTAN